jgi:hypothetical protein
VRRPPRAPHGILLAARASEVAERVLDAARVLDEVVELSLAPLSDGVPIREDCREQPLTHLHQGLAVIGACFCASSAHRRQPTTTDRAEADAVPLGATRRCYNLRAVGPNQGARR